MKSIVKTAYFVCIQKKKRIFLKKQTSGQIIRDLASMRVLKISSTIRLKSNNVCDLLLLADKNEKKKLDSSHRLKNWQA